MIESEAQGEMGRESGTCRARNKGKSGGGGCETVMTWFSYVNTKRERDALHSQTFVDNSSAVIKVFLGGWAQKNATKRAKKYNF